VSKETLNWLRENVRVGYQDADNAGPAWWRNAGEYMTDGSHFPGSVPLDEVQRILAVPFVEGDVQSVYIDADGNRQVATDPTRKTIVSADDGWIHGIFSAGYQIHGFQTWLLDQLSAMLDQGNGELGIASVGRLRNRSVAFVQVKLEGSGMEVGGYGFAPFIHAASSVDGSLASTYGTGVTGIVCDNTLHAANASAISMLKVKSTKNSAGRLGEVRDRLGLVYQAGEDFIRDAGLLQSVEVTGKDFTAWLDEMQTVPAPDPKSSTGGAKYSNAVKYRDALSAMWAHDPKVKPWAGTAFGVLQLVNTYDTWTRNVAGAEGGRMERVLLNSVTGKQDQADTSALVKLDSVLSRKLVMV
jgi:phage/plasmid-like protein (TIGR03299 family)